MLYLDETALNLSETKRNLSFYKESPRINGRCMKRNVFVAQEKDTAVSYAKSR